MLQYFVLLNFSNSKEKVFYFLNFYCCFFFYTADNFTLNSGDNTKTRCVTSVLLMPNKKFVMDNSQVSFDYRVDSRTCGRPGFFGCDGLAFYIDNQQMLEFQGNQFQWSNMTYRVTVVNNHYIFIPHLIILN